ncbi:MAG: PilN domain-containing protein [Gammaproteobacteria bacterium]|nr:PilN domain-containing protein [Gammaproteobacteria bacterium]
MKQNVNLLAQQASAATEAPQLKLVLGSWVALAAVLLSVQWWWHGAAGQAADEVNELQQQLSAAETELNALTAAQMAGSDSALEAELNVVMSELDLRETILGLVAGGHTGDVDGFSAQIRALARRVTEGVWLTRVEVTAPAARTTLEGRALSPEFVPLYLRGLSSEKPLAGQRFDRFEISRPDEPGDTVAFALNRVEAEPGS